MRLSLVRRPRETVWIPRAVDLPYKACCLPRGRARGKLHFRFGSSCTASGTGIHGCAPEVTGEMVERLARYIWCVAHKTEWDKGWPSAKEDIRHLARKYLAAAHKEG